MAFYGEGIKSGWLKGMTSDDMEKFEQILCDNMIRLKDTVQKIYELLNTIDLKTIDHDHILYGYRIKELPNELQKAGFVGFAVQKGCGSYGPFYMYLWKKTAGRSEFHARKAEKETDIELKYRDARDAGFVVSGVAYADARGREEWEFNDFMDFRNDDFFIPYQMLSNLMQLESE